MERITKQPPVLGLVAVVLWAALTPLASARAVAQAPPAARVFYACYVPSTGTVYRIDVPGAPAPGAPTNCTSLLHRRFSWTDGVLTRLETNGFAVWGTLGSGTIPASGPGVRLMWYPGKAAFRVGEAYQDRWDDANVGTNSTAMGRATIASGPKSTALGVGTIASGEGSTAMGWTTTASGGNSTAMGFNTVASGLDATAMGNGTRASGVYSTAMGNGTSASGHNSTAMGDGTRASGVYSTAIGLLTTASGDNSTAMGRLASTSLMAGSFVYGDASTVPGRGEEEVVSATAPNSFVVRAQQVWFGRTGDQVATAGRYIETSTGAYLSDGGNWHNASDVNRKENFREEDAAVVLERLARLQIRSWNYKAEDASVRHVGPTAQDFYAAFQLGDSDRTISTVDAAGVALLSIQALEQRTWEQMRETESLRTENAALQAELAALRAEIAQWLAVLDKRLIAAGVEQP